MVGASRACVAASAVVGLFGLASSAWGAGDPSVAALQVVLKARGHYSGTIDGVMGAQTASALRRLQRRSELPVDGVVGPRTRAALGPLGGYRLGSRMLARRAVGWDVSALQFLLAWHGFPSGVLNGVLGNRTALAIRRFQRWAGLSIDGRVGPLTLAALREPPAVSPIRLGWPVQGPLGDRFGPRGSRFHAGVDSRVAAGTVVVAAGPGRVTWAGRRRGGWGLLVTIAHSNGVRSMYAHLSRIDVRVGERIAAGSPIGLVGATGHASGPHLHFELRLRGAAIDPLTALS